MNIKKYFIIYFIVTITLFCNSKITSTEVRKSALTGKWYTSNPEKLASVIDNYMKRVEGGKLGIKPLLLILPHAGYIYSGKTAAAGYVSIKGYTPDIIVIIAPSHYSSFKGCSILPVDYYETPLGRIKVDKDRVQKLLKESLFLTRIDAHKNEHSIEIHLPFLQRLYQQRIKDEISIIPILVGDINVSDAASIALSITRIIKKKKNPLFIISSDFTHYGDRFSYQPFKSKKRNVIKKKIKDLDYGAIDLILNKDLKKFSDYLMRTGVTICGRNAIKIALALSIKDFRSSIIAYDTSGNITGDYNASVSYASIAFSGSLVFNEEAGRESKFKLSGKDKRFLLDLAKSNLQSLLHKHRRVSVNKNSISECCKMLSGVFVTLKKMGRLRGCIGYVEGIMPIYQAVIDNSSNAAFNDPRFPPLIKNELNKIEIEISVLTPPLIIGNVDEIEVGRDGLIIEQGYKKGLLLPQVPVDLGWDREKFLIQTCRKAGLSDYAWKHGARVYTFQAIVFNESDCHE